MTVDDVRREREARERTAFFVAAKLPLSSFYVTDNEVRDETTHEVVHTAASHWDACLVVLAANSRIKEDHEDAYGRTGAQSDCDCCGGSGVEYDETCVTCGGFGWVRA